MCQPTLQKYINKITLADCLDVMRKLPNNCIDLVLTDPPYLIKNTKAGGQSEFSRSIQRMNDQLVRDNLTSGVDLEFCKEILRLQKKINAYIWCNKEQILPYLIFFVKENKCSFDILCWQKSNAMPTFNNKYLTDKEYCLYFRKGGYCNPKSYEDAKTIFNLPINIKDKNLYGHPTIKPLSIFMTLIKNSTKKNDIVLDCYSGSGTTAVACDKLDRRFICIENNITYWEISCGRREEEKTKFNLFDSNIDNFAVQVKLPIEK